METWHSFGRIDGSKDSPSSMLLHVFAMLLPLESGNGELSPTLYKIIAGFPILVGVNSAGSYRVSACLGPDT